MLQSLMTDHLDNDDIDDQIGEVQHDHVDDGCKGIRQRMARDDDERRDALQLRHLYEGDASTPIGAARVICIMCATTASHLASLTPDKTFVCDLSLDGLQIA